MLHPHIRIGWSGDPIGYALFATEFIPKGTITWALDKLDRIFLEKQIGKMESHYQKEVFRYGYRNAKGNYIVCWDLAKYMNHSCAPNTLSPGLKFDIAIRDIEKGEEVTTDYSSLNLEEDLNCCCQSKQCRGTIVDLDFDRYVSDWDDLIQKAFENILSVQQPLMPWVNEQKTLRKIVAGDTKIPSIMKHKYRHVSPELPEIFETNASQAANLEA